MTTVIVPPETVFLYRVFSANCLLSVIQGIKNRKRSRMVFDETTQVIYIIPMCYIAYLTLFVDILLCICVRCAQEWKARWGYKRIDDPKDNWVVEVPDRAGGQVI